MKTRFATMIVSLSLVASFGVAAAEKAAKLSVAVEGKNAFVLTLPPGWSSKIWKKKTILIPPQKYPHIQLWCLTDTKSLDDAVKNIAKLVESEVLKFKTVETEVFKVAGAKGVVIKGTGLEADDQDPSRAEVFVFSVNKRFFLLCVHGEGEEAEKFKPAVKNILKTVEWK